jgi:hypothetical protein
MEEFPEGTFITVSAGRSGNGSTVTYHGGHEGGTNASAPPDEDAWSYLRGLAVSLGAVVERLEKDSTIRISFRPE